MSGSDLLKRRIDHFEARNDSVSECADRLRDMGIRVCSFENLPANRRKSVILKSMTLRQLLDEIVARNRGYRWDEPRAGLINLFPQESVLGSPVPTLALSSKGAWRVLEDNLRISVLGILLRQEFGDPDGPSVDLDLEHADLRTTLNAIVGQLEPLVWHVAGQPGEYYLSFTSVPMGLSSTERKGWACAGDDLSGE
jgi:hypothetical protein